MYGRALELSKVLSGKLIGNKNGFFEGVSTDTRSIRKGELFVALKGPKYDAHSFIGEAIKAKASGLVVERKISDCPQDVFVIEVKDTKVALKEMASYWRKKINPVVIGVTGSCGKTTTKELIFSIISAKEKTLKNHANFNNFFGVCQTLLKLRDEKFAVIEMGINNPLEMEELVEIAKPQLGIITNIAPVHLEGLKSMNEVYKEKKLLLDSCNDAVFVNSDDRFLKKYKNNSVSIVTFGKRGRYSYKGVVIKHINGMVFSLFDKEDREKRVYDVTFPYTGVFLPENAAGAAAIGRYLGIEWESIIEGIKNVKLPALRMETIKISNCHILLDAYNANPTSVNQAIETFKKLEGEKKTVVLGDMKELGRYSKFYHQLLGRRLLKCDFQNIILVGREIFHTYKVIEKGGKNVFYFENTLELKPKFEKFIKNSELMLIKGSRLVALEKLVRGDRDAL